MRNIYLFIAGVSIALLFSYLESHFNGVENVPDAVLVTGIITGTAYSIILIIVLPAMAVSFLKKKLHPKALQAYSFTCGISTILAIEKLAHMAKLLQTV